MARLERFTIENHRLLAFLSGVSAYPIGAALLSMILP